MVQTIENEWIPVSGGRKLAAKIWLPDGHKASPAILEYLPYRKRDGTAPRDETTHKVFASDGYACVRVDIAGTGDSEGLFDDEYSEQELSDGEAVLSWIEAQDWCDGNIGMIGISWGGFNGLQLAYRQPPSLKAVVSVASTADRFNDDAHYMGGCLLTDNFSWSAQMFAYLTKPADPLLRKDSDIDWQEEFIKRLENVPFLAAIWQSHPTRDDYWKHASVCEDWSKIKAPVLTITGWSDAYINTPSYLAKNLQVPVKAMVGPWEHRYGHISKIEPADFHSQVLGWFDRWLKNEQNNAEHLPDYRVFMQEHDNPTEKYRPRKGRWVAEQNWPSPHISEQKYYLQPNHTLASNPETGEALISSPLNVGEAAGYFCPGMRFDHELPSDQASDDAGSTCFDIALSDSLEILGRPKLHVQFSVDKPVAQLVARLCDVSPQGISQRITFRSLNLNHHLGHEKPELLVPGKIYQAQIELNECAYHLREGHQLRLALSSSYWPVIWPSPELATITLHLEQCHLTIPTRNVSDEIDPCAPKAPIDYPVLQEEILRKSSGTSSYKTLEDGTLVRDTFDDFGKAKNPYHGMIMGGQVHTHHSIHPQKPETAHFHIKWNYTFERDDWQISIDTESSMDCDKDNFYLQQKLHATLNGDILLTKQWRETIKRGLL
ncbi:MAG: CocE/NonD family hydrolase [Alphaproteobacteria bacterium]|nr:CocE/NonD family hydrolase [Alphaproteobacteria bacterium]